MVLFEWLSRGKSQSFFESLFQPTQKFFYVVFAYFVLIDRNNYFRYFASTSSVRMNFDYLNENIYYLNYIYIRMIDFLSFLVFIAQMDDVQMYVLPT